MSERQTAGDVLAALMTAYQVSGRKVATAIGMDPMQISRIRNGMLTISPRSAALLGEYFSTGALFWLDLQAKDDAYRLTHPPRDPDTEDPYKEVRAELTKIIPIVPIKDQKKT